MSTRPGDPDDRLDALESIESTLCDADLDRIVDMVVSSPAPDRYRAASNAGSVDFTRDGDQFVVTATSGDDPLADQSTDRFVGLESETSGFPTRKTNSYPHAFESIAQFFDSPHAPDAFIVHTASHHHGGYLGQHGSLGVVQCRAPFLAAGAGITNDGIISGSTRVVDVGPTLATLLEVDAHPDGRLLSRQDGRVIDEILDGTPADHVVAFLLDGCNGNLFHDVIASGEAPNLGALLERGTSFSGGAMAAAPTATLANHTTALTGSFPGHSGVLHNTWHDRGEAITRDLLAMDQMFWAADHIDPDVETVFEAVHRTVPDAFTTATFEFCDRGADFSSFSLMRNRQRPPFPDPDSVSHMNREMADREKQYEFMSMVDHTSARHTIEAWERTDGNPLPRFSWCSFALTDEAGHKSGPHGEAARASVRDSDGRVGDVVAAVDRAGCLDRTAFLVVADHGMEQNDPDNDHTWDEALNDSGIDLHLVGGDFVYLGAATADHA